MKEPMDVMVVIDGYSFFQPLKNHQGVDVLLEATGLTGLARSHGHTPMIYVILHEYDQERRTQYGRLGHMVRCMNGDRPTSLPITIKELAGLIVEKKPRKLIVVGNDETLAALCVVGSRFGAEVLVWNTGETLPPGLQPYSAWRLADLLPAVMRQPTRAVGWLDAENLLISLQKQGLPVNADTFFQALKSALETLGTAGPVTWQAWADWSKLRGQDGQDFQRAFEQHGAKTHYQISLPGKSTTDMAIVGAIHEALQRDEGHELYIIGTGDGDFLPTVDAIHARGKQVAVIAVRGCLNARLAACADRVIYLNDFLSAGDAAAIFSPASAADSPSQEALAALLAVAQQMERNHWKFIYPNNIPNFIPATWVEAAVSEGLLHRQHDSSLVANMDHPIVRATCRFGRWLVELLNYCFHKPNPFPYVDTAYLLRKAQETPGLQEQPFAQQRMLFIHWLDAAAKASLVQKDAMPHPKTPERIIITWRLRN